MDLELLGSGRLLPPKEPVTISCPIHGEYYRSIALPIQVMPCPVCAASPKH